AESTTSACSCVMRPCESRMSYLLGSIWPATIASKFSLRNSIFRPHQPASKLARPHSIPLLNAAGATSAFVVPQKLGPGRLVTTLSTPAFPGLQSLPPAAGAADPPAAV